MNGLCDTACQSFVLHANHHRLLTGCPGCRHREHQAGVLRRQGHHHAGSPQGVWHELGHRQQTRHVSQQQRRRHVSQQRLASGVAVIMQLNWLNFCCIILVEITVDLEPYIESYNFRDKNAIQHSKL